MLGKPENHIPTTLKLQNPPTIQRDLGDELGIEVVNSLPHAFRKCTLFSELRIAFFERHRAFESFGFPFSS